MGTMLDDSLEVPWMVVQFVATQLGIDDPSRVNGYGTRVPTKHEHLREWDCASALEHRIDRHQERWQPVLYPALCS